MADDIAEVLFETPNLIVRAFRPADTRPIHRILNEAFGDQNGLEDGVAIRLRREWVDWNALSHRWFPRMHQAPYGDRAVVLRHTGELVGSVGLVPIVGPFAQIPGLGDATGLAKFWRAEAGLFWVIDEQHRGHGYATEAARGLVDLTFRQLRLAHIIATTEHDNLASQAVMRKLGMRLERNPFDTPEWLQAVGILANTKEVQ